MSNKTCFVCSLQGQISKPDISFPTSRKRNALTHCDWKKHLKKIYRTHLLAMNKRSKSSNKSTNKFTDVHHKYEINMFACNQIRQKYSEIHFNSLSYSLKMIGSLYYILCLYCNKLILKWKYKCNFKMAITRHTFVELACRNANMHKFKLKSARCFALSFVMEDGLKSEIPNRFFILSSEGYVI